MSHDLQNKTKIFTHGNFENTIGKSYEKLDEFIKVFHVLTDYGDFYI